MTEASVVEAGASRRFRDRFAALAAQRRAAFVAFITAGDPDYDTALSVLEGLPLAGADVIELGMPFSDPVADGPAIQAASGRALTAGMSLRRTIEMVRAFRRKDDATPLVLMGYFNPIHRYGSEAFARDAGAAGVDGLIVVDLPPEEDAELRRPAAANGIDLIRLVTPTTDDRRLERVLAGAGGFVYYVSVAGVTGGAGAGEKAVAGAVARIRTRCALPVAVGFGIKTPEQAGAVARVADGVVVGSALVQIVAQNLDADGKPVAGLRGKVLDYAGALADAVHAVRRPTP